MEKVQQNPLGKCIINAMESLLLIEHSQENNIHFGKSPQDNPFADNAVVHISYFNEAVCRMGNSCYSFAISNIEGLFQL